MTREHLGLFDTPPTRREIRLALAIVGALLAAFVAILPFSATPLGEVTAFIPVINAIIFAGELIIATMLCAQAAIFRSRALMVLASGYLFIALLLVPYVLTFPGVFAPDGLLGAGLSSAGWVMIFRRIAFPLFVITYVFVRNAELSAPLEERQAPAGVLAWIVATAGVAVALSMLAILGNDLLPPMFANRSDGIALNLLVFNLSNIVVDLLAIAALFPRRTSVLDVWLLVALAGWLIQSVLNLEVHSRFTLGWYALQLVVLLSHLIVLVALIAESNRLYARLALAMAARNRERDARLMSMNAVAAAIAHELGQPLTAVVLNAKGSLNQLSRPQPDLDKLTKSLRAILDAGHLTFDVLKSTRAILAEEPASMREFDLNELVRETMSLLDHELADAKVALHLALDEALPPIVANRIQLQRVLVNLVINAIESLAVTQGYPRRVTIRSETVDGDDVLLEISDTGVGIAPEQASHIFDTFFTTKATGTGLGLSLSRTVIQEHGGRIWATPGQKYGATFHLQLPTGTCARRVTEQ